MASPWVSTGGAFVSRAAAEIARGRGISRLGCRLTPASRIRVTSRASSSATSARLPLASGGRPGSARSTVVPRFQDTCPFPRAHSWARHPPRRNPCSCAPCLRSSVSPGCSQSPSRLGAHPRDLRDGRRPLDDPLPQPVRRRGREPAAGVQREEVRGRQRLRATSTYHQIVEGESFNFHVDVTCMNVYDGNRAKIGGVITVQQRSHSAARRFRLVPGLRQRRGSDAPPDRSSLIGFGNEAANEAFCNSPNLPRFGPWDVQGNVQVRP